MTTILSFLFVLSILVVVHEFGHYAIAKLFGIGVERFSVGMPPRLFGIQIGETDYCISSIPFGGYVKLTGQSDFADVEDEDYGDKDYRKKPALVKIAVLAAGSIMNLITAVVIFFIVYWMTGVAEITTQVGLVKPDTLAQEIGLRRGDEVIAFNGKEISQFDEMFLALYTEDGITMTVSGESGTRELTVPRRLGEKEDFGMLPYYEAIIKSVVSGSPAEKAGIVAGDIISSIGGEKVDGWEHMRSIVEVNPDTRKMFGVTRNGKEVQLAVEIGHIDQINEDGTMISLGRVGYHLEVPSRDTGAAESFVMAGKNTWFFAVHTLDFFIKLVTGRMSMKLVGGPVMIAQMAGESAQGGFMALLGFTAFISINLGVLNLLPFPVLDGGHIAILLLESIFRRKLSEKAQMAFQQAGSLVLLLFMLYITFNDVMRFEFIGRLFGGN